LEGIEQVSGFASHLHPGQVLRGTSPGNSGAVNGVGIAEDLVGGGDELEQLSSLVELLGRIGIEGGIGRGLENVGIVQRGGNIRGEDGSVTIDLAREIGGLSRVEGLHDGVIVDVNNIDGDVVQVVPGVHDLIASGVDVPHGLTTYKVPHTGG